MNSIFLIVIFCSCITFSRGKLQCEIEATGIPTGWIDMDTNCIEAVIRQIQDEIHTSMKYLSLGARFSQVILNRPGFADFFFKSASDKREQAIKLIEYLLMRTDDTHEMRDMIQLNTPRVESWKNGTIALEYALKTEAALTKKIKYIIEMCEDGDYHLADYLTVEFLDKQYHDQRNLAEKIATLKKMSRSASNYAIGEFLFDEQFSR